MEPGIGEQRSHIPDPGHREHPAAPGPLPPDLGVVYEPGLPLAGAEELELQLVPVADEPDDVARVVCEVMEETVVVVVAASRADEFPGGDGDVLGAAQVD